MNNIFRWSLSLISLTVFAACCVKMYLIVQVANEIKYFAPVKFDIVETKITIDGQVINSKKVYLSTKHAYHISIEKDGIVIKEIFDYTPKINQTNLIQG